VIESELRVLAVGSMYPPHSLGGYEVIWRSCMAHLREIGWEVRVLATDLRLPEVDDAAEDPDVHRVLRWYWRDHRFPRRTLAGRVALERHNARLLERHLREFRPSVVNWWAMGGMSLSLIERARRHGIAAVGTVCDDWMVYGPRVDQWLETRRRHPRLSGVVARAAALTADLDLGAAGNWLFISEFTRRRALAEHSLPRSEVAHAGIDLRRFQRGPETRWQGRLLYSGRLDARKGIDAAVQALTSLPAETTLRIVGGGDEDHTRDLRALAAQPGLEGRVEFAGHRPQEELPAIYAQADALLFPVTWQEPWGLVPLEAMAAGTPVIASGTGGSGEYLEHEANCLIAPPGDPDALATAVMRLAADEALRARIREGGVATAARYSDTSFNDRVARALEREATPSPSPDG
jgi:glycogen synthase